MKEFDEKNESKKVPKRLQHNLSKNEIISKAFFLHSQGNIPEAVKYYQYFLTQGFKDHRVLTNYGVILKDLGKFKDAELSFRKAIEIKPDYANAYSSLGNLLSDLRKSEEAELSYRKAIEIKPDFAEAHFNLGNILSDLHKSKEAELAYRKAIEIKPDYAKAHANLGAILLILGESEEAEMSSRKAIEIKPDFAEAHHNLGNILNDLGKLEEAEMSYRKAIEIKPDYAEAHANLGAILLILGKLEKAELSYRKAIDIKPDYAEAYDDLGKILLDLGKLEELILISKSIIESISINKGYKLRALINITISNLLLRDYDETFLFLNKTKGLISQRTINIIKEEKNRNFVTAYFHFISSLYPLLEKENNTRELKIIPHIGESHCLSFAYQTLSISSQIKQIKPVLIKGAKAWHFSNNKYNNVKDSLNQQIKKQNASDEIFISFGEIDCRKDEGIISFAAKNNQDISNVCEKTIIGYLDYMEKSINKHFSKRYYFGVPAPCIEENLHDDLDIKRIKLVKIYNSLLKKEVLSRGSYFLNVYALTSTKNGINNKLHMCDKFHLSPKCLSTLFENYLHEPKGFI